jgi:hypothetical protein
MHGRKVAVLQTLFSVVHFPLGNFLFRNEQKMHTIHRLAGCNLIDNFPGEKKPARAERGARRVFFARRRLVITKIFLAYWKDLNSA